jgi:hypothetical protein
MRKRKLREAWCDGCGGLSLMGGSVAVAQFFAVDRRTVCRWRASGRLHAWPGPTGRGEYCACSACGRRLGESKRCEWCRKEFGDKTGQTGQMGRAST